MAKWVKFTDTGRSDLTIRATSSGTVSLQLLSGATGLNLSTVGTVEMWLRDNKAGTISFTTAGTAPKLIIVGTSIATMEFIPGTGSLIAGSAPYQGYFKLYRTATTWDYCPEGTELTINVREAY